MALRGPSGAALLAVFAAGCGQTHGSFEPPPVEEPKTTRLRLEAPAPRIWGSEQRLLASDAAEFDQLGYSVSITPARALVGAYGADLYRGAAYVFVRDGARFGEEQKLVASDGVEDDYFGWSVSLDDERALIGAYADDAYRGAAYVFVRSGSSWLEEQKLVASDGTAGKQFGFSVTLAGDRALIGEVGGGMTPGAAYVFVRSGSSWTEEQKLVASDGAVGDKFGYAVSLTEERALVGSLANDAARGAAYVFVRSGSSWAEEQKLVASDASADDHLGVSVSLTAERAMVGAYWDDALTGAAYGFVLSGSTWTEEQKLLASDGAEGNRFGNSLSLGEDRVLIGAHGRGAAYVFVRDGNSWTEEQSFVAGAESAGNLFGWSVSLADDGALVGAFYDDNLRGAGYVFSRGLANGGLCSSDAECANGHCIDERCCNIDCTGECGACSTDEGADEDGTCTIFSVGTEGNPPCDTLVCNGESPECALCESDEECPDARYCAADQTCQPQKEQGETCNPSGGEDCFLSGCRVCESDFCVDGVCCEGACDGPCEACSAELKSRGEDGTCGAVEALPSPEEGCTDNGSELGQRCASDDDCASGHCTDGVCCDTSCDATCEGCTAALKGEGEDGTCGYVAPGLNPPRSASDPARECEEHSACPSCDGRGRCECGPNCESDDDCPTGERCASQGECVKAATWSAPREDPGCGCRAFGGATHARSAWLFATLALLLLRRARA